MYIFNLLQKLNIFSNRSYQKVLFIQSLSLLTVVIGLFFLLFLKLQRASTAEYSHGKREQTIEYIVKSSTNTISIGDSFTLQNQLNQAVNLGLFCKITVQSASGITLAKAENTADCSVKPSCLDSLTKNSQHSPNARFIFTANTCTATTPLQSMRWFLLAALASLIGSSLILSSLASRLFRNIKTIVNRLEGWDALNEPTTIFHGVSNGLFEELQAIPGALNRAHTKMVAEIETRERLKRQAFLGVSLAQVAHDLKSFLNNAETMARKSSDTQLATKLQNELATAKRTLHDLMDLSRFETTVQNDRQHQLEEIDVTKFLLRFCKTQAEIAAFNQPAFTLNTQILLPDTAKLKFEGGIPGFSRVLMNLITNAKNALPHTQHERHISIKAIYSRLEKKIILSVSNPSPPIPAEIEHRMFEVYVSGLSRKGGTGFGLAIVKSLVEQSNGKVNYSYNGAEVTFQISIPAQIQTIAETPDPLTVDDKNEKSSLFNQNSEALQS